MVFKSILDNDVYKFHMGCIFWDKFRGTPTEYAYTCRDKDINLRPIYRSLCQEIEAMQDVTLTKEEQKWLFENTKVTQDYLVNFLSKFKYLTFSSISVLSGPSPAKINTAFGKVFTNSLNISIKKV